MMRPLPLRRYITWLNEHGYAPEPVLLTSGISLASLDDPQFLIATADYFQIVGKLLDLAKDDGIGLDIGMAREVSDFRIMGYAAMTCRTIRESVEDIWYHYGDALGMMSKISITMRDDESMSLLIESVNPSPRIHRFTVEETLSILLKVGTQVAGTRPKFDSIELSYADPGYGERYRELFQCPVKFGKPLCRVIINAQWLDSPLATADAELHQIYRSNLVQLKHMIDHVEATTTRLRNVLNRNLGQVPTLEQAATALGTSPRSLRRSLQQEGENFRNVVDQFRLKQALDGLQSGQHSAKQLAQLSGFDDTNAFRRAFKKWTGMTVHEAQLQQHASAPPKLGH
ncbi:AraC family transcriptional regulator (plasmid) [Diaphorobacter sp. HDW4B]|uniref:AraC family transcriptional regulator n=1 Tax=Diaphorobacter sp. HDW4B TaxID=2714925 RepID=UPI00140A24A8|nr:AraC family transcriptional regulator [Diaphorobacter sp. HDW4B]QIL74029.1 AraC family transcriptional regulator [Diaphorobacter sp. HDW4B]